MHYKKRKNIIIERKITRNIKIRNILDSQQKIHIIKIIKGKKMH